MKRNMVVNLILVRTRYTIINVITYEIAK
jgi:hypothetical protein